MYAVVTQRKLADPQRIQAILQRADQEFFPKLQQAPGFVSFDLVQPSDDARMALICFESQAQAEAFRPEMERWFRTLEEMGSRLENRQQGEVIRHLTPKH